MIILRTLKLVLAIEPCVFLVLPCSPRQDQDKGKTKPRQDKTKTRSKLDRLNCKTRQD